MLLCAVSTEDVDIEDEDTEDEDTWECDTGDVIELDTIDVDILVTADTYASDTDTTTDLGQVWTCLKQHIYTFEKSRLLMN